MRGHFKVGLGLLAGLSIGLFAGKANAQVVNGDFSGSLSNWTLDGANDGNVSVQDTADPGSAYYGLTGNQPLFNGGPVESGSSGNEFVALVSGGPASLDSSENSPVSASQLDSNISAATGSPTTYFHDNGFVSGSMILQKVNVTAGQAITFNDKFLTDQDPSDPSQNAGVYFVGPAGATYVPLANASAATNLSNGNTPFAYESSWNLVSSGPLATSGEYLVAIVEANTGDINPSAVLVDNVVLTPEPTSLGLLGVGSLSLILRRRRAAK